MFVIWEQVFLLFLFAFVGFCLGRKGLAGQEQARVLSTLSVYVFLPCRLFKSFANNVTVPYMKAHGHDVLLSAGILLVVGVASYFAAKLLTKEPYERTIYEYSMTSSNFGYMGYALAASLYGESVLADMMFFGLPVTLYNYTYGFCTLTKRTKISLRQLLQPSILAILLGIVVGLTGLPMPRLLTDAVDTGTACVGPISMLLMGITVSAYSFKSMFCHKGVFVVTALRVLILPCLLGLLVKWMYPPALLPVLLIYAMPNGLNPVLFPRLVGEKCELGAGLVCLSTPLACLTIPLILTLLT